MEREEDIITVFLGGPDVLAGILIGMIILNSI